MGVFINGSPAINTIMGPLTIGDAGSTSNGLTANDDLFVSGKLEVDGSAYLDGSVTFANNAYHTGIITKKGAQNAEIGIRHISENVTVPVGSGLDPVVETSGNLAPASSLILGCCARVSTAPGGGATTLDIGITGSGNLDALVDGMSTAATTTATSTINNDGTQLPLVNASAATLTLTTDADVTDTAMVVRISVFYIDFTPQTL